MYYYIKMGQYPNISVNSDIVVDSTPKPDVVHDEVKRVTEVLRTMGREVNVFNLSNIKRNNGFLHFVSEYLLEVKVGNDPGFVNWRKYNRNFLDRMWKFDKKRIEEMGLNSKFELWCLSRKRKNNGFPICKV